jgi:hypothetical protein
MHKLVHFRRTSNPNQGHIALENKERHHNIFWAYNQTRWIRNTGDAGKGGWKEEKRKIAK